MIEKLIDSISLTISRFMIVFFVIYIMIRILIPYFEFLRLENNTKELIFYFVGVLIFINSFILSLRKRGYPATFYVGRTRGFVGRITNKYGIVTKKNALIAGIIDFIFGVFIVVVNYIL